MAFRRLILFGFFLCFFAHNICAISSVAELYVSPKAVLPKRGVVNYGAEFVYSTNQHLFYTFSLSDNFQVGMKVTEDFDMLMGVHANLFEFELFSANHYLGVGDKNLGWNLSSNKYNTPIIGEYGVYTINFPGLNPYYHFGLAEYKTDNMYYFTAGAEYHFRRFNTMTEWDGRQIHCSILYHVKENYDFFISITPSPYNGAGVTETNNLTVSFIRKDLFFNQRNQIEELTQKYNNLKTYLDVTNAKLDVFKEFSSVDFLEEFQQFLLQEHMVEKELAQSKKSVIRSALDHMQRGLEFYYKGQYQLALEEYKLVVNLVPNFSMAYARLGSIYYKLQDLENSKLSWEKALELDPSNQSLKIFLKRVSPINPDVLQRQDDVIEPDNLLDIIPAEDHI